MKTEVNSQAAIASLQTNPVYKCDFFLGSRHDQPARNLGLSPAPQITLATQEPVKNGISSKNEWNSLKSLRNSAESNDFVTDDVATSVKLFNDLKPSFTSMVIAFMVMSLQLFSNFQKADMEMALNQLNLILMEMKKQISELKAEQASQFEKDIIMATVEAVGAAVSFIGSAVHTCQLGGKLIAQAKNSAETNLALISKNANTVAASTTAKSQQLLDAINSPEMPQPAVTQLKSSANQAVAELQGVTQEQSTLNSTVPPKTLDVLKEEGTLLRSKVDLINARQQLVSGLSGLIKATSPAVQGHFGNQATGHQIMAKEAENAKEIANSIHRQYMEWVAATRDAISRMVNMLQDILSQDPNNSLASSRKMA